MTYPHYPMGWSMAGNTPFKMYKQNTHAGGNTDPFIIHWPAGITAKNEVRGQYTHAVDVTPTVMDLLGIERPAEIRGVAQSDIQGASFGASLGDASAPSSRRTQYYEMLGNRAIYHDGWKAVVYHGTEGMIYDGVTDPSKPFDEDRWELYHVENDPAESHDLASEYPEKLQQLQALWWAEAGRYQVLPLDARSLGRAIGRPRLTAGQRRFTYYPSEAVIEAAAAANTKNRSHSIVAEVEIADGGAEGVLIADGGRFGGYSLYVRNGRLCYTYNFLDQWRQTITSSIPVPAGASTLAMGFEKTGNAPFGPGGIVRLYINGEAAGEGELPRTVPFLFALGSGLQCGRDGGNPVTDEYRSPYAFTGTIKRVVVDLNGPEPPRDLDQEAEIGLARQ